ncbi:LysR family transcriptional regulator [Paraburkholderia unamae]|uniref:LysR family transcriptional regulator n=1 Tax=Paraburkholderia unamae TaxID=219649 RepID=A0ABX5KEA3_9BURK|nr:LysR family transcriptional regulator [Paraburkholderia unamae]PVX75765.1 LysR family transcriptional regulator [Paraburkholderia unamae]RAR57979.1 LysR family transcriptional regulator [Paraburkholderia unamae]CAG9259936.1 LysR family transcriptional regulator [Paraburkholderia unamae]
MERFYESARYPYNCVSVYIDFKFDMSPKPATQAMSTDESPKASKPHTSLRISSRHVALLYALNEFRNMRRAADAMHTTQPAASLLLQQLEERLGVKLFERLSRGMEPTAYGEVMIRYAQSVLHDFEHAEAEIAELAKGAAGLVRVGTVMGPVPTLLTRALAAFKQANQRVRLSIEVGTSDTLLPALLRGDLDVVLGRLPDQFNEQDLNIEPFEKGEQMRVIARPDHPLAGCDKLRLATLVNATWILHPLGSPMRRRVEGALQEARLTADLDIVETASILATTAMIEASDMISVVPNDVAQHYAKYGMVTILPVALPLSMANLGIVTRKSRTPSPAVQILLRYLKEDDHPDR